MKRFYCKVCKRVKRVRRVPLTVDTPSAYAVTERVGMCSWHVMGRVHIPRTPTTRIKSVTITKTAKVSRKGGR